MCKQAPFLYAGGEMQNLSFLGPEGEATGINNHSQVVGNVWTAQQSHRAFIWQDGLLKLLPDQLPGWVNAEVKERLDEGLCWIWTKATAISDSSLISGNIHIERKEGFTDRCYFTLAVDPVLWTTPETIKVFHDVSKGPVPTLLHDVNSAGTAVGYSYDLPWGVLFYYHFQEDDPPLPVPGPGWKHTDDAFGINEHGHVVGWYTAHPSSRVGAATHRAFWWDGAYRVIDIGVLPTGEQAVAHDVNDQDFVVGYGHVLIDRPPPLEPVRVNRGFLYHEKLGLYVLPAPFTSGSKPYACEAYALTNFNARSGLVSIVGFCETPKRRAVRWDVKLAEVSVPPVCCTQPAFEDRISR